VLSEKDLAAPSLSELLEAGRLPDFAKLKEFYAGGAA